jgi:integrase/recombinase XerD
MEATRFKQPSTESYIKLAYEYYLYVLNLGYGLRGCRRRWAGVSEFLCYAEERVSTDFYSIGSKDILAYQKHLKTTPNKITGYPLSDKTIWSYMCAIESLYVMLEQQGKLKHNPFPVLKRVSHTRGFTRTILTQEEIQIVYAHAQSLRDRAMLSLAYGCGLRLGEMVQCNIEDLRLREGYLVVKRGKGNKSRMVPMSKAVIKDVSDYLYKERLQQESSDEKAFILHNNLGRMQDDTYNKFFKRILNRTENEIIKSKAITMHSLRHSIATHLIEQGVPLEKVKEFLGHSQLETTEIYTHISKEQLKTLTQ